MKIAIIGLGYVGLPLALQFARSCTTVLGLDIDPAKVDALNAGTSYIKHISDEDIKQAFGAGKLFASTDFRRVREVEAVIICVPTPLNKNREPDISYITQNRRGHRARIAAGTSVVLESTTYPGTTDEDLRAVLREEFGTEGGSDFHLAFSPEREDQAILTAKCHNSQGHRWLYGSAAWRRRSRSTGRPSRPWCPSRPAGC